MFNEKLFSQINSDTTILTPNSRLSATLHKHYQQYQIHAQRQVWQTPDILPVSSWLQHLWNDYISKIISDEEPPPLILSTAQEQYIWETIVASSDESSELLQVTETADIALTAWILLKQWQIDINHPLFKSADDYLALQKWALHYQKICKRENWAGHASLPDLITAKIKSQSLTLTRNIILTGFTEIPPQTRQLLRIAESAGSTITHLELSGHPGDCKRIGLMDHEEEIYTIARWAKQTVQQNPSAVIGCVLPGLDKNRDRVSQIFTEVFADHDPHSADTQTAPFNISAGKSLLHYPIISAAMQFLSLHRPMISCESLSYILASPFLGGAESERIKRASFDSQLRQNNLTNINLSAILNENTAHQSLSLAKSCPDLYKRLSRLSALLKDTAIAHSCAEWAALFTKWLTILGWPGERSLSSDEYQTVERWLALLDEYMTLDQVTPPVSLQQALHILQKMASKTVFQTKTPDAPIQVLGVLEAAAIPFDYLWIAGMDDVSWPPQPRPNPFIPKRLQRELHMPHATAERELIFCSTIIDQFRHSASHVIFSHAEKNEELELQASPLIRHLPEIRKEDLELAPFQTPASKIFASRLIDTIIDETAPEVVSFDKIRGGVSVIKTQALCPFRAFSEWRLHAHELESPLPGLRAKDRGTVIHKALEIFWSKIRGHSALVALDEDELFNTIHTCIDEAITSLPASHREFKQYISLEKQRLQKLMQEWLNLEKERMPFIVDTHEKAINLTIGKLPLTIRIDRIDELSDGKKLIIDYKTGKNNETNSWFSERPEEPQLPVYALLDPANTIGITFAQISPGESCFKGVSRYALDIKGIKIISEIKKTTALSWDEQIKQWNSVLTRLSDDFYHGSASVDPKDPPQTCTWCALQPLCRINEEQPDNESLPLRRENSP
jgi:probable DNA repair protein